ncbi:hypothetical protein RND71_039884 [Anisodus tanguticus]|uniref:Uncharacterized protein n=1 Tax=Anisodus tanguticus TaxID=243964 RepID=A0AAE1QXL5_9SOLA|nr:hypothetical protein RND71_039884 [Anisodus tanguticus]
MKELLEIVDFQKWNHLFSLPIPSVFEEEVANFYWDLFDTDDDILMVTVNGTNFVLDEEKLGKILSVPTDELKIVKRSAALAEFLSNIVKQDGMEIGATIFKKHLKPEYKFMFELVNKVLLPIAESGERTRSSGPLEEANAQLKAKNEKLKQKVEELCEKVV